jgi:hypothetical protein
MRSSLVLRTNSCAHARRTLDHRRSGLAQLSCYDNRHNNTNHNDRDAPKEISNCGFVAYLLVVSEIERAK